MELNFKVDENSVPSSHLYNHSYLALPSPQLFSQAL